MGVAKTYDKLQNELNRWFQELEAYNDYLITLSPREGKWSMGQFYNYLTYGNLTAVVPEIENSLDPEHSEEKGSFSFIGFFIILLGFGSPRLQTDEAAPEQPRDLTHAKDGIVALLKKMRELRDRIDEADYIGKTKHPRYGYLSASRRYKLIYRELRNQRKQKKRLAQFLERKIKEGE